MRFHMQYREADRDADSSCLPDPALPGLEPVLNSIDDASRKRWHCRQLLLYHTEHLCVSYTSHLPYLFLLDTAYKH